MRNLLVILALFFVIVSCSTNTQPDIETEIVMKIMNQKEMADSNLTILNFKQGQITQYSHNDTVDLILNGFLYATLISRSDSSGFNLFPESAPLFQFQGFWDSEKLKVTSLSFDNLVKIDSIPGLGENQPDSIYNFDWTTIPSDINGFTTFSAPVFGDSYSGFISQLIYTRTNKLYMKLYRFDCDEECKLTLFGCRSFNVIAFYISLKEHIVENIEPRFIIVDEGC